jgi:hypothetical protein
VPLLPRGFAILAPRELRQARQDAKSAQGKQNKSFLLGGLGAPWRTWRNPNRGKSSSFVPRQRAGVELASVPLCLRGSSSSHRRPTDRAGQKADAPASEPGRAALYRNDRGAGGITSSSPASSWSSSSSSSSWPCRHLLSLGNLSRRDYSRFCARCAPKFLNFPQGVGEARRPGPSGSRRGVAHECGGAVVFGSLSPVLRGEG